MKFRTAHVNYSSITDNNNMDVDGEPLPSACHQSFMQECDINHILKLHDTAGILTHVNRGRAHYGDFVEGVNEYKDAMDLVVRANESFDALPSDLRSRFGNDPGLFMEFIQNPANYDEGVSLGLFSPRPIGQKQTADKRDDIPVGDGSEVGSPDPE